jgi:hypothetical protein
MSSHPSIFRIKITKQTHSIDGHTLPIKKIDIQHTISNPFFSKKIQAAQDKVNRYFSKTLLISSSSLLLT